MQFISKPQPNAPVISLPTVATPTFSPVAGSYPVTQSVTISCSTPASNIFYTTDGSVPTTSSIHYTAPISVSVSETLNAIGTAVGFLQSAVGTAVYSIAVPQTGTPTFAPVAGTYVGTQSVAISCSTPSSSIYFTTDGTTPTFPITGTTTLYTGSISVAASETLKAIGTTSGFTNSNVASAAYVINAPVAAIPTFSPVAGTYASTQTVTLTCSTPSSSIYFTTDGSTPTLPISGTTTLYSTPVTVSATETIKAIGTAAGFTNSSVGSALYTIGAVTTTVPDLTALPSTFPARDLTGYAALNVPAMAAGTAFNDTVTGVRTVKITASGTPSAAQFVPTYSGQGLFISLPWGSSGNQYTVVFQDTAGNGWLADYQLGGTLTNYRAAPSVLGSYSLGRVSFSRKGVNPHILYVTTASGAVRLFDTTVGVMAFVDSAAVANGYSASWPSTGRPWTTGSSSGWFMVDATETWATAGSSTTYFILNLVTGATSTATDGLDDIYGGYGSPLTDSGVMTDSGNGPPFDITTASFRALSPALTGSNWDGSTFSHMASLAGYWTTLGSNKGGGSMQMIQVKPDGTNNANSNVLWPKYWGQMHRSGHWWLQGGGANQYWLMSVDTDGTAANSVSEKSALTLVNADTGASRRVGFHYSASAQSGTSLPAGTDGYTGSPGGTDPYWGQAHASMSHDGKLVLFGSNMGNTARIDAFLMEVPTTAGTPPSFP